MASVVHVPIRTVSVTPQIAYRARCPSSVQEHNLAQAMTDMPEACTCFYACHDCLDWFPPGLYWVIMVEAHPQASKTFSIVH